MNMDNDTSNSVQGFHKRFPYRCDECGESWSVKAWYDSETGVWYYPNGDSAELCPACNAEGTPEED